MSIVPEPLVADYSAALTALGICHEVVEHPASPMPLEVVTALGLTIDDSMPTLVTMADGSPLALILPGAKRADLKRLKKELGLRDLRMATPEEFTHITGLTLGAARPSLPGMRTLIERGVFEKTHRIGGTGSFSRSIRYLTEDLRKLPGAEVRDFTREDVTAPSSPAPKTS